MSDKWIAEDEYYENEIEVDPPSQESDRLLAALCFAGGLATSMAGLVVVIIIWAVKKDSSRFIDQVGKEVLNFQISYFIYLFAAIVLSFAIIGIPMLFVLIPAYYIFTIIGIIQAFQGRVFRVPLILRFIN